MQLWMNFYLICITAFFLVNDATTFVCTGALFSEDALYIQHTKTVSDQPKCGFHVSGQFSGQFGDPLHTLTCSCPRMMTPPGLMGCHAARLSPVPCFSPSWKASHWPSRVVQEMQMWCHLPSRTSKGSWATWSQSTFHINVASAVHRQIKHHNPVLQESRDASPCH